MKTERIQLKFVCLICEKELEVKIENKKENNIMINEIRVKKCECKDINF